MLIGISFHRKVSLARDFLHFYDSFYDFFFVVTLQKLQRVILTLKWINDYDKFYTFLHLLSLKNSFTM